MIGIVSDSMQRIFAAWVLATLTCFSGGALSALAADAPPTVSDENRLIRLETKVDALNDYGRHNTVSGYSFSPSDLQQHPERRFSVMHVTATELQTRLDRYLEAAQAEPVIVEKSGRARNVVLSKRRYDQLCELEDKLWAMEAQSAEQEGFLSDEEARELLKR